MDINVDDVLGQVIRGALGARRKRHRGALGYLVGGRHSLLNASTLVAAAGVAWGLYESATQQSPVTGQSGAAPPPLPGSAPPVTPPPIPGAQTPVPGSGAQDAAPPPIPGASAPMPPVPNAPAAPPAGPVAPPVLPTGSAAPAVEAGTRTSGVTPDVERVIRLTISAARADGDLSQAERDAILAHARQVHAEAVVDGELRTPTPLPALVAGVPEAGRRDLYSLAFAIVRADETVSDAERAYLSQLAQALGLEADTTAALEHAAAARIAGGSQP